MSLLRRVGVFVAIFGVLMAAVIWQAGGLATPDRGRRPESTGPQARPPDEPVVPIEAGASLGSGSGVRVARDAVEVVDGEPIPYRAYEASWDRQTPLPGGDVDERRLRTESFHLVLFHRRPTAEEPRPPAVEGPDTTRVTADEADLQMRPGAGFRAQLAGDVEVVRHDVDEDLTLRSASLDLERVERSQGAEEVHATTDDRVFVDGRGAHIEGTGLEADLGRRDRAAEGSPARVTLRRDVRGTLLARPGALTGQGGNESGAATPTSVRCSGAAELVELERGDKRRASRWLATFVDDVVVEQDATELRCATLEIEFRMAGAGSPTDSPVEVLRVVADGDVVVTGSDAASGDTWSLRAPRSVTTRDAKGGYDVVLTGGTTFTFSGTLRGRGPEAAQRGRVEVRCAGPATVHTDPEPLQPGAPVRSRLGFRDDVTVRQWNATGALETEVRAPVVTLLGNRGTATDGGLDPETLTASGDSTQRAHVRREALTEQGGTLTAQAQAITWRALREHDVERLLLTGRPAVRFDGVAGVHLLGGADAAVPSTLLLDADDHVEVTWRHETEGAAQLPAGEPHVTAIARGNVVARRLAEERESYRLEAQALDATLDRDLQPDHFRAYGNVVVTGRGERPGDRDVDLRGDRLAADRAPVEAGADVDFVTTDVIVFGQASAPATAVIREPPAAADQPPATHIVRAEQLRYEQGGTLLTAKRGAEVLLDRAADGGGRSAVSVRGAELRAHLNPAAERRQGAPEVLRVEGEGGVTLETDGYRVNGSTMSYDLTSGIATAEGRPARGVLRQAGLDDVGIELESFIASDKIRVEFDPTTRTPGRPRRVTCQGGLLRYYQLAAADGGDDPGNLARVTLQAEGPLEVIGDKASAETEVEIVWETRGAGGRMKQDARLLCDRADIDFDTTATGPARDRIRRAVATGSRRRAAQLFSPNLDATADRVESTGPWIDLLSPWGRRVHVSRREPAESFTCDKGRYNYVTQEFEATRMRAEER